MTTLCSWSWTVVSALAAISLVTFRHQVNLACLVLTPQVRLEMCWCSVKNIQWCHASKCWKRCLGSHLNLRTNMDGNALTSHLNIQWFHAYKAIRPPQTVFSGQIEAPDHVAASLILSPQTRLEISRHLLKTSSRFHTYKCWNIISNSGL